MPAPLERVSIHPPTIGAVEPGYLLWSFNGSVSVERDGTTVLTRKVIAAGRSGALCPVQKLERAPVSHRFHKLWLKIAAVIVGSFAPVFFLATMPATREPARLTLDILSWPPDGATTYASPDVHFLSALTGGFLMGWGVTLWLLSSWVYDAAPDAVRKAAVAGFMSWFVLDSAGSIASGNASNAVFNVFVLLAAVGPLWRPARG